MATDEDVSTVILSEILADLTDRRGFRQQWEGCDDDIQEEIRRAWLKIIRINIKRLLREKSDGN